MPCPVMKLMVHALVTGLPCYLCIFSNSFRRLSTYDKICFRPVGRLIFQVLFGGQNSFGILQWL